jgi:hypothetical protein
VNARRTHRLSRRLKLETFELVADAVVVAIGILLILGLREIMPVALAVAASGVILFLPWRFATAYAKGLAVRSERTPGSKYREGTRR